jgi:hypothetical protein
MIDWKAIEMSQAHYADLLSERESDRLASRASAGRRTLVRRLMAWLGLRLITWGTRLHQRSGQELTWRQWKVVIDIC